MPYYNTMGGYISTSFCRMYSRENESSLIWGGYDNSIKVSEKHAESLFV